MTNFGQQYKNIVRPCFRERELDLNNVEKMNNAQSSIR